jgi:hypothetical protein
MSYTSPSIIASGGTWAQLQAGGLTGQVEALIAKLVATLAPTVAAAWTATGGGATGGALAAGTYYQVITESNGIGETTIGPESTQITVSATNIPRITFQTLKTGNVSRNVYLSALNGVTGGPYFLYADGITAATYDLAVAAPDGSYGVTQPPATNTTAPTALKLQMLHAAKAGNLETVYKFGATVIKDFLHGDPQAFGQVLNKLRDAHLTFALLAAAFAEIGVLIDANPGSIGTVATFVGNRKQVRTWP